MSDPADNTNSSSQGTTKRHPINPETEPLAYALKKEGLLAGRPAGDELTNLDKIESIDPDFKYSAILTIEGKEHHKLFKGSEIRESLAIMFADRLEKLLAPGGKLEGRYKMPPDLKAEIDNALRGNHDEGDSKFSDAQKVYLRTVYSATVYEGYLEANKRGLNGRISQLDSGTILEGDGISSALALAITEKQTPQIATLDPSQFPTFAVSEVTDGQLTAATTPQKPAPALENPLQQKNKGAALE